MARPKAFTRETVLSKAMALFWRKGYEATSVQDLVEATGINRGSLYDTFEGKRQLFLAAIDHYVKTVVIPTVKALEAPGVGRAAIEAHFYRVLEQSITDAQRRGCLMTNTVVELAPHDGEVAQRLKHGLQRVEDAFYTALVRACNSGEIRANADLRGLARYLTASMQGLRVMAKVNPDLDALTPVVVNILAALEP